VIEEEEAAGCPVKPLFISPRRALPDNAAPQDLRSHEARWNHMASLAGDHRQEDWLMDLTGRAFDSPDTLKYGVPPRVAQKIRELKCPRMSYNLPQWLDVVSSVFPNLKHLHLGPCNSQDEEKMRRLYVLYRLPDLETLNGIRVNKEEQEIARPISPSGRRVRKEEWVKSIVDDTSDDDSDCINGDILEVGLNGRVRGRNPKPKKEEEINLCLSLKSPTSAQTLIDDNEFKLLDDSGIFLDLDRSLTDNDFDKMSDSIRSKLEENMIMNSALLKKASIDAKLAREKSRRTLTAKIASTRKFDQQDNLSDTTIRQRSFSDGETTHLEEGQSRPSTPPLTTAHKNRSLTSPFPLQFRRKAFGGTTPPVQALPARNSPPPPTVAPKSIQNESKTNPGKESTIHVQSVSNSSNSVANSDRENAGNEVVKPAIISSNEPVKNVSVENSAKPVATDEKSLRAPLPLTRPPTCPGARRVVRTLERRPSRKSSRWRRKANVSIADWDDEVETEEEELDE